MKIHRTVRRTAAFLLTAVLLTGCVLRDATVPAETDGRPEDGTVSADIGDVLAPVPPSEPVPEPAPMPEPMPEPGAEAELTEEIVPTVPTVPSEPIPEAPVIEEVTNEAGETAEEERERRIAEELSQMTVREKLGQMFMISLSDAAEAVMEEYAFGSVLLFAPDFELENVDSVSAKMSAMQAASEYGLLTAVDEEGGTVTRISRFTQYRADTFKSPRTLYSWGGMEAIAKDTREKSALLKSLGLNMNMAPVADISVNQGDFMYWRSIGLDAEGTSEFVRTVIREAEAFGIASVVKHFPGYGSVADTHTGMAYDDRSIDELSASDLLPFRAAAEEGAGAIMVSHIITSSIDAEKPASVSEKAVALIRVGLDYDGVIITDDLAMAGITDYCTTGNAALEAILAGCDLLCCTNWNTQYDAVWSAVQNGTISEDRLTSSAARVLRLKYNLGLWE